MAHLQTPTIRIKDAFLLRENASEKLNKLKGGGKPLRSNKQYEHIVESYQKAWQPYERTIIDAMCKLLVLEFQQNIIDVYIAPEFMPFSDPLVIGTDLSPDFFIDILTHELLHRLLTDNTSTPYEADLFREWQQLFGKTHSFTTLVHIPVHAVHKAIYLDKLQEEDRLSREFKALKNKKAIDYIKAWDYVNAHGHENIIKQLKDSYDKLVAS